MTSSSTPVYGKEKRARPAAVRPMPSPGRRLLHPERFLSRFSRVTSGRRVIPEIEGLRFYSLAVIMAFHLVVNLAIKAPAAYAIPGQGHWVPQFLQLGAHAVELFFVISGFILACPFAMYYLEGGKQVRLKQYFLRRLTRLEPPYFLCMIGLFVLIILTRRGNAAALFPHLAASMLYLHNLVYGDKSLINVVAWSLEVEIQFYVMVPLLAMVFRIRRPFLRRATIVVVGLCSITYQWLFIGPEDRLYLSIVRFLHFFLLGFLLADVYLFDWRRKPTRHLKWDLVTLAGWPALIVIWNTPEISHLVSSAGHSLVLDAYLFPFLTFFLYCAVFRGVVTNRILTNIWITTFGGMCYTIYLFHNKLIGLLIEGTGRIPLTGHYSIDLLIQALMVMPVVLILSAVYFVVIERPCMQRDWPRRLRDGVRKRLSSMRGEVAASVPKAGITPSHEGAIMPHIDATVPEVRKFGITFAALALAAAGFSFYKGSGHWTWFAGGALFFLLAGLLAYPVLKPVYTGWMTFAHALAWFNTRLIMGLSFYTVFTPIAVLFRVFGKDPLGLRIDKGAASYWIKRGPAVVEKKRYEQLF